MPSLLVDVIAAGITPNQRATDDDTTRAEQSLREYSKQAWSIIRPGDKFIDGYCFGCVAEHVQAVYEGQIKKLGVAIPPRHGKSLEVNVFAPSWGWTRDATLRYIFTSYSDKLAKRDSIATRDIVKSPWYQDRWGHRFVFKEDQNRQDQFTNDRGGFRIATTPGGMATGEGADIITADDITSVEDSFSGAALERAWRYWTQTMTLRFHDPESVRRIVSMQRTRKTDLLGRLIAEEFGYEVLTLPFEGEPHRIYFLPAQKSELGLPPGDDKPPKHAIIPTSLQIQKPELRDNRKAGEVLWPERFTNADTIKDLKKSVQAGQAGQLQQRPEEDAGAVFKGSKFKLFFPTWSDKGLAFYLGSDEDARLVYARECLWYQTVDTAMKAEQANDETAIVTSAKSPFGDLLFFDVAAMRLLVPEQWPAMKQFRDGKPEWNDERREWRIPGRLRPWPKPLTFQSVEDKNSGTMILQTARSESRPLHALVADGNKVLRAATLATLYENGVVYHNAEGEWRGKFEDQLTSFPAGAHDDMVDAAAYAAILFVHDDLIAAYSGDMVYNESVHAELEIADQMRSGADVGWVPPALRPQGSDEPADIDGILAALQGRPKRPKPAVSDAGEVRPEYLHEED